MTRIAGVLGLATLSLMFSWQTPVTAQRATFKSGVEVVNLNVTVTGQRHQPVDDLTENQFEVFEDGVPQQLQFFAAGDFPLDVIVLIDASGSMGSSMPLVQQAAQRFIGTLRPDDRAAIMAISRGVKVVQAFTGDRALLGSAVTSTRAGGGTPLYTSIYTALTELAKARRELAATTRRQALVVLSDGIDTSSTLAFDDLLGIVRRNAIPIYVIAPRPTKTDRELQESAFGESTTQQDYELRTLSTETGGRAVFPSQLGELATVYKSIADELAHQYSLGYQSSNRASDGSFRRISVRVLAPGLTWRARAGYLADVEATRVPPAER